MTTLIHVIEFDLDPALLPGLRVLLERLPADQFTQRVVAVNSGAAPCDVASLASRVGRPVMRAPRTWGAMDPFAFRALAPYAGGAQSVLHAWGVDAQLACRRQANAPGVFSLNRIPEDERGLRRMQQSLGEWTVIAAGSQYVRRRAGERGIDPRRVAVVRLPVDFAAINELKRRNLRAALAPSDAGPIILVTGPARRDGGQFEAVWAAAIVQHIYPNLRVVVPFASSEHGRINRFLQGSRIGGIRLDPPADWGWPELVCAADLLVEAAPASCATEPLAWAMAAGLPVVATAIRSAAELIAARHTGLLCKTNQPARLAAAMVEMLDDAALRRSVTGTARGQAYEVFSLRAFLDNMIRLYDNVLTGRSVADGVHDTAMVA